MPNRAAPTTTRDHRLYAWGIGVVGVGSAIALSAVHAPPPSDLATVLLLAAGVLGFLVPLRLHRRGGVHALTLEEAAFVGLLFVARPEHVPAWVGLYAMVGFALSGRPLVKAAFAGGQKSLGAIAGVAAFVLVGAGGEVMSPRSLAAAVAASIAFNLVTYGILFELFRRLEAIDLRGFVRASRTIGLISWVANTLVGLLFAVVAMQEPWAILLVGPLAVALSLGYRGYARVVSERERTQQLHDIAQTLSQAAGSPVALERFVAQVAELLGGESAALALRRRDDPRMRVIGNGGEITRPVEDALNTGQAYLVGADDVAGVASLARQGHRDAVAAPLRLDGTIIGALAVYDRLGLEPWGRDHLTLLSTLANEAATAANNVELVASLERESRTLGSIVRAASDGIVMIEWGERVLTWNPAMEAMTGIRTVEAIGCRVSELLCLQGEQAQALEARIARAFAGDADDVPVDLDVGGDDDRRWLRCTLTPVDTGDQRGAVMVVHDVTTQLETEQLKNDFIATISHELRTPLTPLRGFLATAIQRWRQLTPDQLDEMLAAMQRQLLRLEALVADLLLVADLDSDQLALHDEVVDVEALAQLALTLEAGGEERVRLSSEGACHAVADQQALSRVLRALIGNAVKHTAGPVGIEVRRTGDEVLVEVADSGPGIPESDLERVFEPFARLGNSLRRPQGSGLGLAIARSLAERLGGELELASDPDAGTRLVLHLSAVDGTGTARDGAPTPVALATIP